MPPSSAHLHDAVDRDRLIARTQALVRIPSVNPFQSPLAAGQGEAELAQWLEVELSRLGFTTGRAEAAAGRPNVWGLGEGGAGPVLGLVGHLDTVGIEGYNGDPFSGDMSDDRIHGRGSCDMKGAFACFLEVAEVLRAGGHELAGRLMIAGIADEEAAMLGSSAFGSHAPRPDMAIVGEPTELSICSAHLGQYAVPIRTFGRAVHSSIASQGVNAIEHMMRVVESIGEYRDELASREGHAMCGAGTASVGVIRGGDMVSIVPDWCELEVDRRMAPGETSEGIRAEIEARLVALGAADEDFRWELGEPLVDAKPLDTAVDSPLVRAAQDAARTHGRGTAVGAFSAATDAPNLGVPAIIWGPGSLAQAHTVDEYVEVDQLVAATHMYLDAVLELIG